MIKNANERSQRAIGLDPGPPGKVIILKKDVPDWAYKIAMKRNRRLDQEIFDAFMKR